MDELTIGDKVYISSKGAAKLTGYAKDYIGQLCREGRVEARLVGRNWYVLEASIREHRFGEEPEPIKDEKEVLPVPETAGTPWVEPEYIVETPSFIPVLSLKPEVVEEVQSPVVADMQSAWNEWFSGKSTEPKVEAAEEVLEVAPEEEPIVSEEIPEEPVVFEEEEPVEEEIQLHRVHEEGPQEVREVVEEEPEPIVETPHQGKKSSRLILKSVFALVAVLAMVIGVIGTGSVEIITHGNTASVLQPYIEYLEGTSDYKKGL